MANTTNLNLEKPIGTDQALVSVINSNMDKIDTFAGSTNQAISTLNSNFKYGLLNSGSHNANDFEHLSCYMCNSNNVQNIPQNLCHIFTIRTRLGFTSNTNYAFQIAVAFAGTRLWIRAYGDNGWSEWTEK